MKSATVGPSRSSSRVHVEAKRGGGGVLQLACASGQILSQYYAADEGDATERTLQEREVLALNAKIELKKWQERYVAGLPSSATMLASCSPPTSNDRPVAYVVGERGTGRTFFAMKELRNFGNHEKVLPAITLYVKPGDIEQVVDTVRLRSNDMGACDFLNIRSMTFAGIVDLLWRKIGLPWSWNRRRLHLHVCLVLDDADADGLRPYFTNIMGVDSLLEWATRDIAASVALVFVSKAIPTTVQKAAYVFRTEPWQRRDLEMVLNEALYLRDEDESSVDTVAAAAAVLARPELAALAGNARSACALAEAIAATAADRPEGTSWDDNHLSYVASDLVSRVETGAAETFRNNRHSPYLWE